jgi:NTE family protein
MFSKFEEAGVKNRLHRRNQYMVIGLYASGYNAAQIDSIFQATDFSKLLNDYIPLLKKSFMKRNEELYAIVLPLVISN